MAVFVCGRFGCGRFGMWPFWMYTGEDVDVGPMEFKLYSSPDLLHDSSWRGKCTRPLRALHRRTMPAMGRCMSHSEALFRGRRPFPSNLPFLGPHMTLSLKRTAP